MQRVQHDDDGTGKIWVSDGDAHAVYAFPVIGASTGNLNIAPSVTLDGAAVAGGDPSGIAIDETGHIYVTDSGDNVNPTSIYVFAPGATGAAAPTATITGIATLLGSAYGVRAGGGFIYVADAVGGGAGLLVFKTTDTGNVAPTRQIVGATTTLTEPEGVSF